MLEEEGLSPALIFLTRPRIPRLLWGRVAASRAAVHARSLAKNSHPNPRAPFLPSPNNSGSQKPYGFLAEPTLGGRADGRTLSIV